MLLGVQETGTSVSNLHADARSTRIRREKRAHLSGTCRQAPAPICPERPDPDRLPSRADPSGGVAESEPAGIRRIDVG